MPFVTEYNISLVLKTLIGEIPHDIQSWEAYYKKPIFFLNRLDKTNLLYLKEFCENPIESIDKIYNNPIEIIDKGEFVHEGGQPSYHKIDTCEKLSSNFINFKIPEDIKKKGSDSVKEFRKWFKENQILFSEKPDIYQMMLSAKYSIHQSLEKVNYNNSGNVYKENLTLDEIETRIDSLLHNAAEYYKADQQRQYVIERFQKATYLAFKKEPIVYNISYTDYELKEILKEYFYRFIQPTIFYLKEHIKISYNSNIEINETIFEYLNFKKCNVCYADDFEQKTHNLSENKKILKEKFGDFEFPIEPTQFHFKDIDNTDIRQAFIYCRIFRSSDTEMQEDENGNFKMFKAEFINHKNKYIYIDTKIYEEDIPHIQLFRKYITKIEQNKTTRIANYTTYNYELANI